MCKIIEDITKESSSKQCSSNVQWEDMYSRHINNKHDDAGRYWRKHQPHLVKGYLQNKINYTGDKQCFYKYIGNGWGILGKLSHGTCTTHSS